MIHDLEHFKYMLKNMPEDAPRKKTLFINDVNFETISISSIGESELSVKQVAELSEYLNDVLSHRLAVLNFISTYHPNSPSYWKTVDKYDYDDDEPISYSLSINLESFMDSNNKEKYKDLDYYIPDNYELAEKVLNEFEAEGGDVSNIGDTSYRELAQWQSPTEEPLLVLAEYIDNKYVKPKFDSIIADNKIKNVTFVDGKVSIEC